MATHVIYQVKCFDLSIFMSVDMVSWRNVDMGYHVKADHMGYHVSVCLSVAFFWLAWLLMERFHGTVELLMLYEVNAVMPFASYDCRSHCIAGMPRCF